MPAHHKAACSIFHLLRLLGTSSSSKTRSDVGTPSADSSATASSEHTSRSQSPEDQEIQTASGPHAEMCCCIIVGWRCCAVLLYVACHTKPPKPMEESVKQAGTIDCCNTVSTMNSIGICYASKSKCLSTEVNTPLRLQAKSSYPCSLDLPPASSSASSIPTIHTRDLVPCRCSGPGGATTSRFPPSFIAGISCEAL